MNIAVLSDTRLPTRLDYPGHGLGRSLAKIAFGLAQRGHRVTVFGAEGTYVPHTFAVWDKDENARAEVMVASERRFDVYLDGTHFHRLAEIAPADWPVVARFGDQEGKRVRGAVYNCFAQAALYGDEAAHVIHNGYDVDEMPYNPGPRGDHVLFVGWLGASRKRPELAAELAMKMGRPLKLIGAGVWTGPGEHLGALSPAETLWEMSRAAALLATATFNANQNVICEANATGTPVLALAPAEGLWHGVTGYEAHSIDELAQKDLGAIRPGACREWIRRFRSLDVMIRRWEMILVRAMDGERW